MRRNRREALVDRLLSLVEHPDAESPPAPESTIDVDRYLSPSRFADERRILFREHPIIVGRDTDLPEPGSFFTHDASGIPLLVTRDTSGVVRAMLNVCRHRGSRLVPEGAGKAKAFVCRYHAWTYGPDGALGHVTLPKCFPTLDRAESGLVQVPCEVRHGFVWVVPTPLASGATIDIAASLGDFDDDLQAFELDRHVVFERSTVIRKANWKLVMDAFLEGYHVRSLHQRTLARFFRDDVVIDMSGPHVRSVGARKNLPELRSVPRESWDFRGATTVFYSLFPNMVIVFHPQTVSQVGIFPRAVDEVEFVHTMLVPHAPESDAERQGWQKTWELIDGRVFAEEDLAIAESIQSGLPALATIPGAQLHLGGLEQALRSFHDAMDRALPSSKERRR